MSQMETKRAEDLMFKEQIDKIIQGISSNRNDLPSGQIGSCFRSYDVTLEINKITAKDIDFAEKFFKKYSKYLKSLTIKQTKTRNNQNSESKKMVDNKSLMTKFFKMLGRMMSTQPEFECLTIHDIDIFDSDTLDKFADGLQLCNSLKFIIINNCNVDGANMSALVKGFKMANLVSLNLSNNQLTDDSVESINSLLAWHQAQRDTVKQQDSIREEKSNYHTRYLQELNLSDNNFTPRGLLKVLYQLSNDNYLRAISVLRNKVPIDEEVRDEIKNLFEINESLLIFDIREIEGAGEEQVKEILLQTVRNIKHFCTALDGDWSKVQGFQHMDLLAKVFKQIVAIGRSTEPNRNQLANLSMDSLESISFNDLQTKVKAPLSENKNLINIARNKNKTMKSKNNEQVASKKRNVVLKNSKSENEEIQRLSKRCKELENRCLSLAVENKMLRAKPTAQKNSDLKVQKDASMSLNQSNWQPTMHDISEIALISGLSIDRTRQAFTTIIEDSAEFRQTLAEEQDSDITNRIDFLMNELNRILDGVEQPERFREFNSQASINFSKISEPKQVNASISQDNIRIEKKLSNSRMSKSFDKN